jgi:hypothetical protein
VESRNDDHDRLTQQYQQNTATLRAQDASAGGVQGAGFYNRAQAAVGTPANPGSSRQQQQPSGQSGADVGSLLAQMHGLTPQHGQLANQLLQAGLPVQHVLTLLQQASQSQAAGPKQDLENQQFASNMRAENAFGPGGEKAHEADQRTQEAQVRDQEVTRRAAESRQVSIQNKIDQAAGDPAAQQALQAQLNQAQVEAQGAGHQYASGDNSAAGQAELQQRQQEVQRMNAGRGRNVLTPEIAKQFYQQAGGDPAKARALAAAAGYKGQ